MNSSFIVVYLHIVGAILLVGCCLFWAVMTTATRRELPGADAEPLLRAARSAAWPVPGRPLELIWIGWLLFVFAVASGFVCLPASFSLDQLAGGGRYALLLSTKLILTVALIACFPRLGISRTPLAILSLGLALAIVATSALLVR